VEWVLTLGGKLGREHAITQRMKVTLASGTTIWSLPDRLVAT
jgi:hypothetical protein